MMEVLLLTLDNDELRLINNIAKETKFDKATKSMFYPDNFFEIIKYYEKSYRFLHTLLFYDFNKSEDYKDNENEDIIKEDKNDEKIDNIKIKIKEYLEKTKELYNICKKIIITDNSKINYGKNFNEIKSNFILDKNRETIYGLLDIVYNLGRKQEIYDPDEIQGYS